MVFCANSQKSPAPLLTLLGDYDLLEVEVMMPKRDYSRFKTALFISDDEARVLRELAQRLGFYVPRGVGAGEIGNAREVVVRLAEVYQRNPDAVLALLQDADTDAAPDDALAA